MKRQSLLHLGIVALMTLFLGSACDEATQPKSSADQPQKSGSKPTLDTTLDGTTAFNTAVKTIPPKSFHNHWGATQPGAKKKVDLNAFYSRGARRISLKKLRDTIPFLLGGITWQDSRKRNMFDVYALTLGRANYLQLNKNNDSVTKLFMKLMDDMAMNVCKRVIAADYAKKTVSQRVFVRNETDIYANLRFIRLKFHGIYVPASSQTSLDKLKALYDATYAKATKDKAKKAWELVCIATLTSPEFYTY